MWELDYKESWAPKIWCFWTGCWRRLLRIPWTARRSNQSILSEISPEYSLKLQLRPANGKKWLVGKDPDAGKDWRREEKGRTENEMIGWHHQLDGHEFEQAPEVSDRQGGLACCGSWGCKESDTTERLNWTEQSHLTERPCPPTTLADVAAPCVPHQSPSLPDFLAFFFTIYFYLCF